MLAGKAKSANQNPQSPSDSDMKGTFKMENLMDSKYNKYLDSAFVRIALLAVGFSTWLGVSVAVLKIAA
jgi:hypothetical protein